MKIPEIILNLAATPSSNTKLEILKLHKGNDTLKEVFRLAYDPTIQFGIKRKKLSSYEECLDPLVLSSWEESFELLGRLSTGELSGDKAISAVKEHLNSINPLVAEVVYNIIMKDLKCNTGKSIANKVWKGLIPVTPRQGCASMNEKSLKTLHSIKELAVELKSDGTFAASVCNEASSMLSRNGNPLVIECLQEHLSCGAFDNYALEGELVYPTDKANREEGNGIITKVVKGTASDEEKAAAHYEVWDCILGEHYTYKGEWKVPNKERRLILEGMVREYRKWCEENNQPVRINLIERHDNVSVEEAFKIFEGYVAQGWEGAVAKNALSGWKHIDKPTYNIKLKRKDGADLKVVSWEYGEAGSKYENCVGKFICESECGTIKVKVGSGLSDEERIEFTKEHPPIIEVEYDSVTKDNKTGQESLFLPIYKRPRYDKVRADSYEEILDKQKIKSK